MNRTAAAQERGAGRHVEPSFLQIGRAVTLRALIAQQRTDGLGEQFFACGRRFRGNIRRRRMLRRLVGSRKRPHAGKQERNGRTHDLPFAICNSHFAIKSES